MFSANPLERRLQTAGLLSIIGLLIEAVCLMWARPISFVIFVSVGGVFIFAGIVLFLLALVPNQRGQD